MDNFLKFFPIFDKEFFKINLTLTNFLFNSVQFSSLQKLKHTLNSNKVKCITEILTCLMHFLPKEKAKVKKSETKSIKYAYLFGQLPNVDAMHITRG